MHGSPDGPWFFIIARNMAESKGFQLLGITDTAMLRPQVFALQEGKEVSVGLDLLGEAGHRRHAGEPQFRRSALYARRRPVLERTRR